MKSHQFSGENKKKIFNLSSAGLSQRVIKVKTLIITAADEMIFFFFFFFLFIFFFSVKIRLDFSCD